jgi:hypothetical protein
MDMLVSLTLSGTSGGSLGPKGAMPPVPQKNAQSYKLYISH